MYDYGIDNGTDLCILGYTDPSNIEGLRISNCLEAV